MRHVRVLVVGGSGFIGSHVVARLSAQGRRVFVPTRRPAHARDLVLLPTVEVVHAPTLQAVAARVASCDAVVNLVGVLHGRAGRSGDPFGPDFERAHVQVPAALVEACRAHGVRRLVHVSALGVTDGGKSALPSRYLRSKAAGEERIRQARDLDWTILRPSVVFGPGDRFLNLFARLQRWLPVVALPMSAARFQPVYVGDVAQAVVNALDTPETIGRTFELAGPEVFTLEELVRLAGRWSGHERPVWALPFTLGQLQSSILARVPGPTLMSRDNFDSMAIDNVASGPVAPELGIVPTPLAAIAPTYLSSRVKFDEVRTRAHR